MRQPIGPPHAPRFPVVRPGRNNPDIMHAATVTRLASRVPPLGARYGVSDGGRTFVGKVLRVAPLDDKHATITLEVTDAEYERLLAAKR